MLIAITSEGTDLNSLASEKFGRSPCIIFYDTGKNTFDFLQNPFKNIFDGAGIQTSQIIIEKNVSALITTEIGLNAFRFLRSAGIDVYLCAKKSISKVAGDFVEGKLFKINYDYFQKFNTKKGGRRRYRKQKFN
jgi:predicted Fe-Mo cluster-binding NifX family protein